jgi:hypothetical protein
MNHKEGRGTLKFENVASSCIWEYANIMNVFQAYCFCGENLLGQDRCGEAIRALQESQACESQLCISSEFSYKILLT